MFRGLCAPVFASMIKIVVVNVIDFSGFVFGNDSNRSEFGLIVSKRFWFRYSTQKKTFEVRFDRVSSTTLNVKVLPSELPA